MFIDVTVISSVMRQFLIKSRTLEYGFSCNTVFHCGLRENVTSGIFRTQHVNILLSLEFSPWE